MEKKSRAANFDHSKKDFLEALGLNPDQIKFLKKTVQHAIKTKSTLSESLVEVLTKVQTESLGESHNPTEFEILLITAGFLTASIKGGGGGSGEMPDVLKKILQRSLETGEEPEGIQIAIQHTSEGASGVIKGKCDVEMAMALMTFLNEYADKKKRS